MTLKMDIMLSVSLWVKVMAGASQLLSHLSLAANWKRNAPDKNRLNTPLQRLQSTQRKAGGIKMLNSVSM